MAEDAQDTSTRYRVASLERAKGADFVLSPDAEVRAALAGDLGISAVRKLRFEGTLRPEGKRDWRLEARIGATVVQPCGVTLAPVSTRIEEEVVRRYLTDPPADPESGEAEMPEDDTVDELPEVIDVGDVMAEALALALPPFPRAEGVAFDDTAFSEPGAAPLTDDDVKPFAGLKSLRDRMSEDGD